MLIDTVMLIVTVMLIDTVMLMSQIGEILPVTVDTVLFITPDFNSLVVLDNSRQQALQDITCKGPI